MRHIKAVGVIIQNDKGEILVLRRHKNSPEGSTLGLVGGKVDNNEDELTAIVRETREEIGYNASPTDLVFIKSYQWQRADEEIQFGVFKLQKNIDDDAITLETNKSSRFMWLSPHELLERKDLMLGLYPILEDHYRTG
jgi:8-oxo-dGTP diphosphatase